MTRYYGVEFDDVIDDEYGVWSQLCKSCFEKYKDKFPTSSIDDVAGGICGVSGCMNEAEYYIDFATKI